MLTLHAKSLSPTHSGAKALFLLICITLIGCQAPQKTQPVSVDVNALRDRHNQNIEKITQFWARTVVEARWTDADGHSHFEQGDGPLIFRRPHDLALSVGKLGETFFWLGCDASRYWLFNMHPPKGEKTTAFVGRFDHFSAIDPAKLPLPIQPDRLISLIGLDALATDSPLPPVVDPVSRSVTFITQVGDAPNIMRIYTRLDPDTAHVTHVTLTDALGRILLSSNLFNYASLKLDGSPPGAWPDIATRIAVLSDDSDTRITLFLSDPIEGRTSDKVQDIQFDFDTLRQMLDPQQIQSLDAD